MTQQATDATAPINALISAAEGLISAIDGVTNEFNPEVTALRAAIKPFRGWGQMGEVKADAPPRESLCLGRSAKIAAMNDELRSRVGMPYFGTPSTPGRIYITAGVNALPPEKQIEIWFLVRDFADFTPDNDSHGERDFGSFDLEGAGKVFWKIDYYADETMSYGSEDPSDPARCFRALTIMLVSEY